MSNPPDIDDSSDDTLARFEAERLASQLNWPDISWKCQPPQEWFEVDEPKPF
jgi:hypothetical protein